MNWTERMKNAMVEMKIACAENTSWTECYNCPFCEYCTILEENGVKTPANLKWIEKED